MLAEHIVAFLWSLGCKILRSSLLDITCLFSAIELRSILELIRTKN
uniref:Uncharacterized protein n=1 Tax=Rhizophora mucronata TaxID=61149 RepID=A0A2P2QWR9_RHIMU